MVTFDIYISYFKVCLYYSFNFSTTAKKPEINKFANIFLSFIQVKNFCHLGRIKNTISVLKDATFQSKQMGKRENKVLNIEGRVQFDLLQVKFKF